MCGIAGIFGRSVDVACLQRMVESQHHRGPDATGTFIDPQGSAALGHNRLSIIDLSDAGTQPMASPDGRYRIVFNGEIYNYLELRDELRDYAYRSRTDTEVILAAFERWGEACLERFIGMFSFLIWDTRDRKLFAARDRFGVKPLYYSECRNDSLLMASEIRTLRAAGAACEPDAAAWATYLAHGIHDHSSGTFWRGVRSLPAGHCLTWKNGRLMVSRWYDLAERVGLDFDDRSDDVVADEYFNLLTESVRLRFRADVPVGVNLSGGLDSSVLLGLVQHLQGRDSSVKAFTFTTGDARYDELPWVQQMLARTRHPSIVCRLQASEVPELAESVQAHQDEPYGGLPTLAYAKLFEQARREGVIVLLDGQGLDEQWAGYDYYRSALEQQTDFNQVGVVQAARRGATRPECLTAEFASCAEAVELARPFQDKLRDLQYRDTRHTKIPRALRFNDRVSMRASTELREPFLDHRLFELALRQPLRRKIVGSTQKWLLRKVAARLLPDGLVEAPKRPLQTPQREWLRGDLRDWANDCVETGLSRFGGQWLQPAAVRREWSLYQQGGSDNSFYIWQWISLGLCSHALNN